VDRGVGEVTLKLGVLGCEVGKPLKHRLPPPVNFGGTKALKADQPAAS
jgi:hypothetical protein